MIVQLTDKIQNMGSKRKNRFGETVKFTEIFSDVAYIAEKQLENSKLYDSDQFTIVEAKPSISHPGFMYFPTALRKVIFKRQTGSGIIIGQTKRSEGRYVPGTGVGSYMDSDPEPAYLEISNTYTFWVVATDMNKKVLVPK